MKTKNMIWFIAIIAAVVFSACGETEIPATVEFFPNTVTINNDNPTRQIEVGGTGGALSLANRNGNPEHITVELSGTTITVTGIFPDTDVQPITGTYTVDVVHREASATLTVNYRLETTWLLSFGLSESVITIDDGNAATGVQVTATGTALSNITFNNLPSDVSADVSDNTITFTAARPDTDVDDIYSQYTVTVWRGGLSQELTVNLDLTTTWQGSVLFDPVSPVTINNNSVLVAVGGLGEGELSLGTQTGSAENVTIDLEGTTITVTGNRPSSGGTREGTRTVEVLRQTARGVTVSATLTINYTLTVPTFYLSESSISIDNTNHTRPVNVTGDAAGAITFANLPEGVRANAFDNTLTFFAVHPALGGSAITANDVPVTVTRQGVSAQIEVTVNLLPPPPPETLASGPEMVWIPAGTFIMGSPVGEPGRVNAPARNAETQHQVTLTEGFWMMRAPITRGEIRALGITQYDEQPSFHVPDLPWNWRNESDENNRAATHISFYAALVIANKLSEASGLTPAYEIQTAPALPLLPPGPWTTNTSSWGTVPTDGNAHHTRWANVRIVEGATGFRIPTEAQWEYAARAGTITAFNDGITNNFNDPAVRNLAHFWVSSSLTDRVRDVRLLQPNAWGLYDMHGNVWEWVFDIIRQYPAGPVTDPVYTNISEIHLRVIRGGSWFSSYFDVFTGVNDLRSARRFNGQIPVMMSNTQGLRFVRPGK